MTRAVVIAAPATGQGKTSVTAGLARALVRAGERVRVFKVGPDFIDPLLHAHASGAPVHNVDAWMTGLEDARWRLARAAAEVEAVLVEGVMGLYDGTPSTADLAMALDLPVLLVIDAAGMAQTFGVLAQGLAAHRPLRIAGVLANRAGSAGHAQLLHASLPAALPWLGALPANLPAWPERHLGLTLPGEVPDVQARLDAWADALADQPLLHALPHVDLPEAAAPQLPKLLAGRTIAIARDAAFAFIYEANLATLTQLGARLVCFSPLADEPVPAAADALWLPGGYPELHGARLAAAQRFMKSVRAFAFADLPVWAECGGMMVLAQALHDLDGVPHTMARVLAGTVRMHARLAGIGMHTLALPAGTLRGHGFHHSTLEGQPPAPLHTQPQGGGAPEPVHCVGRVRASYFHAWFASAPAATASLFTGDA
jgi:cobyrinic acid a,c-diamide synthase